MTRCRRAVILAIRGRGFPSNDLLEPLLSSWTGWNVGWLGPIAGLIFWGPLGLVGGGLLGWMTAHLLGKESDMKMALVLVSVVYAVSAMVPPHLLNW